MGERSDVFLSMDFIRIDGGTQPRDSISEETVADYAEKMLADEQFPPVTVFHDGVDHWLADGFHRFHAARKIGMANLLAEIRTGTKRDAILHSVGANTAHGLRRSNADKKRAVETLLKDEEWAKWSDKEIADRCAVGCDLVCRLRPRSLSENDSEKPRTYRTKHGTVATMNTANIGKRRTEERAPLAKNEKREAVLAMLEADPMAPTPAIATTVGCSEGFVSELRNSVGKPSVRLIRAPKLEERRTRFAAAMDSLDGYVMGLEGLRLEDFADDDRAEHWAGQLSKLITSLRNLRGILLESRKETA